MKANLDESVVARFDSLVAVGPREGEETEVIEKGGGKSALPAVLGHDPRPGEQTEPIEEGDRPRAAIAIHRRLTESALHG